MEQPSEAFRDASLGRELLERVEERYRRARERLGRDISLMEICGTHTVSISRAGLRSVLPGGLQLKSGPGCPVCVTDDREIDEMIELSRVEGAILATYGDMLQVPGTRTSLQREQAAGADVRLVYSPLDAVRVARENPGRPVIFLGVGFETTAPATAVALEHAQDLRNFYVYCAHKLTPPAMAALMADPEVTLQGFLVPGHVSTILGLRGFAFLAEQYHLPAAVAGFEPVDILLGLLNLLDQLACGRAEVFNAYPRVVREDGNPRARELMARYFEVADAGWRGIGRIPGSGLRLGPAYRRFDALRAFPVKVPRSRPRRGCACGEVLRGKLPPTDCRLFARGCTPAQPVGPCMVSSEGACAAYYRYERRPGGGPAGAEGAG